MKLAEHPRIPALTAAKVLARDPPAISTIAAHTPVAAALRRMFDDDVGALLVVNGATLLGIFYPADYLQRVVLAEGAALGETVSDLMRPCACTVGAGQGAEECLALMLDNHLQHLPVVDAGQLLGLLSRDSLLQAIVAYQASVLTAQALDQRILFLQGTYSC